MILYNTLKLLVLISSLILSSSALDKRDYVTTSIETHLTTQPGGAVITIQAATIFTVTEDATSAAVAATTPSSSTTTTTAAGVAAAAVDTTTSSTSSTSITTKAAAVAVETTTTSSSLSSTSITTKAAAAAVTTAAANTEAVGITTSGEYLGIAKSTITKSTGTKSGETESYTGPRQDPSTSITPLPLSPVTTLKIESFETVTLKDTTYTTKRQKTSMYVTLTVQSMVEVIQTTFAQRFKTMYSSTFGGSSGSIGLGTLTGEIGKVKSSYVLTEDGTNNALVNSNNWGLMGMLLSLLYMFI